jgi:hypothetical protein
MRGKHHLAAENKLSTCTCLSQGAEERPRSSRRQSIHSCEQRISGVRVLDSDTIQIAVTTSITYHETRSKGRISMLR